MMKVVRRDKQSGVAMIEVLVTIIVVAVGLLGAVGLQINSLKAGNNAQSRYQATLLAYDMAERMRANPDGVEAGHYDNIQLTDTGNNYVGTISAANLWRQDVYDWKIALANTLPSGNGSVIADNSISNRFIIRVEWTELTAAGVTNTTDSVDIIVRI